MKHTFKALGIIALFVAQSASAVQILQTAKIRPDFKTAINSITSNSSNLDLYYKDGQKAWNVKYNSTVNAKLSPFGVTGKNSMNHEALTTQYDYDALIGSSHSPFQCVGFVKAASDINDAEPGRAKYWQRGDDVTPTNLPESGTVIATFFGDDGVPGGGDDDSYYGPTGHTAIYVSSFVKNGTRYIYVIDQNGTGDGNIKIRPIPFENNGDDTNNAANYSVVLH